MTWIDYRKLREEIPIAHVMADYGVTLQGSGDQRKAKCPLPACRDGDSSSLSVSMTKKLWKCWRCHAGGNVIDFVALMEHLDPQDSKQFRQAAGLLAEKYSVTSQQPPAGQKQRRFTKTDRGQKHHPTRINHPLDFELKDLDGAHASVASLGLTPQTIAYFGLGYCHRRGMLQGRVAVPLHNGNGDLVGYAGRLTDHTAASSNNPEYLYPDKERVRKTDNVTLVFDRSQLVYNLHRIKRPVTDLFVVEHLHDVWKLHDAGFVNTVMIFQPVSNEQMDQIKKTVSDDGVVWFLTDAGEPLRALVHVAKIRSVRWTDAKTAQQEIRARMGGA